MLRTWKMVGLETLLAVLFAAAPALGSGTSGPPSDSDKLDEIQKQLNSLKLSLAEVRKTVDALSAQEEAKKTESNLGAQKVLSRLAEMEKQISQLRTDVENLRNVPPSVSRSALYPPPETPPGTSLARVEMVNTYSQPVSVVINNRRSYLLQPGERRLSDPIPAGTFTYEVLGVTPLVTRTVGADKIFTIWVHPQPSAP
jgi:DNA-binding transcriptional MerR regulator